MKYKAILQSENDRLLIVEVGVASCGEPICVHVDTHNNAVIGNAKYLGTILSMPKAMLDWKKIDTTVDIDLPESAVDYIKRHS